jgi:hypothetical protein
MSFAMAFVVLFSTMSFTVDMHYCGNTLVQTAIMQKARGCNMKMQTVSKDSCEQIVKNCCSDKLSVVDGQDELQLSFDNISLEQQLFLTSFVYTYLSSFDGYNLDNIAYKEYRPPLVIRQLYKLDETYLI